MNLKPIYPIDLSVDQTNYYWFEKGFNEQEILDVQTVANSFEYTKATIISSDSEQNEVRKSKIKWLKVQDDTSWVFDKLINMVKEANDAVWKFNLYSVVDEIQYTEYYEGGGHYDWHVDIGPGGISHRKVSVVVQLSDINEYEGGDLELWNGGAIKQIPKGKGVTTIFPSFTMHRVTPVTKGIRKSLVLWLGGEHYK